MPCDRYNLGDGAVAIVCSRGRRAKPCSVPGCIRTSTKLCDFKLSGAKAGKTCDRPLCDAHAVSQGPQQLAIAPGLTKDDTLDYCPAHAAMASKELHAHDLGVAPEADAAAGRPAGTTSDQPPAATPRAPVRFAIPKGTTPTKCQRCPAAVFFVRNPNTGRWMPLNEDGASHFATCPRAAEFRRAR